MRAEPQGGEGQGGQISRLFCRKRIWRHFLVLLLVLRSRIQVNSDSPASAQGPTHCQPGHGWPPSSGHGSPLAGGHSRPGSPGIDAHWRTMGHGTVGPGQSPALSPAVWPWACHLTSLSLGILICKMKDGGLLLRRGWGRRCQGPGGHSEPGTGQSDASPAARCGRGRTPPAAGAARRPCLLNL